LEPTLVIEFEVQPPSFLYDLGFLLTLPRGRWPLLFWVNTPEMICTLCTPADTCSYKLPATTGKWRWEEKEFWIIFGSWEFRRKHAKGQWIASPCLFRVFHLLLGDLCSNIDKEFTYSCRIVYLYWKDFNSFLKVQYFLIVLLCTHFVSQYCFNLIIDKILSIS